MWGIYYCNKLFDDDVSSFVDDIFFCSNVYVSL